MFDEEPPVPEEGPYWWKDQLNEEEISLADNEEILHALSELTLSMRTIGRISSSGTMIESRSAG